jgi:hypothetical protein
MTQNTESKKQGKSILEQQIINFYALKCPHNATAKALKHNTCQK